MNKLIVVFLSFFLLSGVAFAQVDDSKGSEVNNTNNVQETPEQKLKRMLEDFDKSQNIVSGFIIVSFDESVERDEAVSILSGFDLEIYKSRVCTEAQTTDPDKLVESSKVQDCKTVENWEEIINAATVKVPDGEELSFAKKLIEHDKIIWVEPSFEVTLDSSSSENGNRDESKSGFSNIFWIITAAALAVIVFLFASKSRKV